MPTPNYSWDLPTINGDLGAWGTKLNAAITDADADLKTVETAAAAAQSTASTANTAATNAYNLAVTVQTGLTNKVLVQTRAPTGSDTADNGVLWCQVAS